MIKIILVTVGLISNGPADMRVQAVLEKSFSSLEECQKYEGTEVGEVPRGPNKGKSYAIVKSCVVDHREEDKGI